MGQPDETTCMNDIFFLIFKANDLAIYNFSPLGKLFARSKQILYIWPTCCSKMLIYIIRNNKECLFDLETMVDFLWKAFQFTSLRPSGPECWHILPAKNKFSYPKEKCYRHRKSLMKFPTFKYWVQVTAIRKTKTVDSDHYSYLKTIFFM